jgi:peptidoglycan/xylan/chitin deacetylase (PgdA/CDA1 family)
VIKIGPIPSLDQNVDQSFVIMYHYVQNIEKQRFPNLHARSNSEFDSHIDYLNENFQIVPAVDLAFQSNKKVVLTFDDGLKDHYKNVFPRLLKKNLVGQFFVSSAPLLESIVLDVHKIQLLVASQNIDVLLKQLQDRIRGESLLENVNQDLYKDEKVRFDDIKVLTFKRLLQRDLPKEVRNQTLGSIFDHYFPGEESLISNQLYMSIDELKEMKRIGMVIGNHTESHQWLSYLKIEEALQEVENCENLLIELDLVTKDEKLIAYPYGDASMNLSNELDKLGYKIGYTTQPTYLKKNELNPLMVPRLDTNDLPYE